MNRIYAALGWASFLMVTGGILTAWMDPSSAGLWHAAALTLVALGAIPAIVQRQPIPMHWMVLVPVACAAWGMIQALLHTTAYEFVTVSAAYSWLARAAFFCLAYVGFRDPERRERLCSITVFLGGAMGLLTILQWYSGDGRILWIIDTGFSSDVAATFVNRDQYAAFIELILPVALAACVRQASSPVAPALSSGLMFASVIVSGSRAGIALVSLEALVFLLVLCCGPRRSYRTVAIVTASLVVCTLLGGWGYAWGRFANEEFLGSRREMLVATLNMIGTKPLAGYGLGSWPTVYPSFAIFDPPRVYMNHAHNDWAEWTAEGGAPFLALLLVFAVGIVRIVPRHMWALGTVAVLVHALVDFPLQKSALACALFFFVGVMLAAEQQRQATTANRCREQG